MVRVDQAREWGDSVIWIDARPDDQFARDHVPGAILLNEDRWNELLPQFLAVWSPGKKIVVYCSAQSCDLAREVAERLRKEAQIPDVFVLEGGWEAWLKKSRWTKRPTLNLERENRRIGESTNRQSLRFCTN